MLCLYHQSLVRYKIHKYCLLFHGFYFTSWWSTCLKCWNVNLTIWFLLLMFFVVVPIFTFFFHTISWSFYLPLSSHYYYTQRRKTGFLQWSDNGSVNHNPGQASCLGRVGQHKMWPMVFLYCRCLYFWWHGQDALPNPRSWKSYLHFSSNSFIILASTYRYLIH